MSRASMVVPRPLPGEPRPLPLPEATRTTLPNGLELVVLPRPGLPQVVARLLVPAGAVADADGRDGLAAMVGGMLTEGTDAHTAAELNRRIDMLGASLGVHVGHDFAEVDLGLLAETLEEGLSLMAEIAARPSFPEVELERLRAETLDELLGRHDEPANVADDSIATAIFGAHPYGRLPTGTVDGVQAMSRADLEAFHRRHYRPTGSVLLVSGDVQPDGIERVARAAFGDWHGIAELPKYPMEAGGPQLPGSRVAEAFDDAAQAEIRVGGIGMPRDHEDWIPASVANYLLGGSTITGRLGANLREEKGWTYGVRSGFAAGLQPGAWLVETAVDLEIAGAALAEIRRELDSFLDAPPPQKELDRARDALVLSLPRAFETPARTLARFSTIDAYGLPHDYWHRFAERVESVTRNDVLRVAQTYFDPSRLVWLAIGPREL